MHEPRYSFLHVVCSNLFAWMPKWKARRSTMHKRISCWQYVRPLVLLVECETRKRKTISNKECHFSRQSHDSPIKRIINETLEWAGSTTQTAIRKSLLLGPVDDGRWWAFLPLTVQFRIKVWFRLHIFNHLSYVHKTWCCKFILIHLRCEGMKHTTWCVAWPWSLTEFLIKTYSSVCATQKIRMALSKAHTSTNAKHAPQINQACNIKFSATTCNCVTIF